MIVFILATGLLFAVGTWLLLDTDLLRIVLGTALMGHGAILLLIGLRGSGSAPLLGTGDPSSFADPVPQALSLTAVVIAFGTTALLVALAGRHWQDQRQEVGRGVVDAIDERRSADAELGLLREVG